MKPLRMGVIGAGFMGANHAKVWSQLPITELIAIADLDETVGKPLAGTLGADYHKDMTDLLARNDIDAVSIVTPDRHHVDPATAAAHAGKHILLEKPMAHDAAAARAIAKVVEETGVRLMIAHVLRFDPRYVQLHAAAAPETLGEPIHLRAKRNTIRSLAARLGENSSILFYLGVHDIDMMQWVARSPITRVYGQKVQKLSNGNEDALYAVVNFENGAIGTLDYSWAWPDGLPSGYHAAFEVIGTRNAALLDVRDQGFHVISVDGPTAADTHLWPEINGKITGDLRDELLHFAEAVLAGEPFVQDYKEALSAIQVLDALFASVDQGQPVDVARA
ncbi:MAG: Gfo/Idh/MocA family oxidoreductase [Alphaproteobacteria bacterium]|nr:Gfo/Idh/MocA family oxidoreductase [Alphaproteobacteria bacterium]